MTPSNATPPLILASGSQARQDMLRALGLNFSILPADIDENIVLQDPELSAHDKALELSKRKALHSAKGHSDAYVIGSDQVLEMEGQIFSKAANADQARQKLQTLSGKTHHLISAVSIAQNDKILWSDVSTASLKMTDLSAEALDHYLNAAGDHLTQCVGAYALEKHGPWLFDQIEGDYFTILGMPLLPLLSFLRQQGFGP